MIEIDSIEGLSLTKNEKISILQELLSTFEKIGFLYNTHTYPLFDKTTDNILLKDKCSPGMPDRYKFCDKENVLVDFTDAAGFTAFLEAILAEKDRIMVKYNAYKVQIAACETLAEVDAIVIDFSV